MKRLWVLLASATTALGLGWQADAQAGIMWSYDWTPGTANVISDSGLNEITFTPQPLLSAMDSSDVVATNVEIKSPVVGSSDTFTAQNYSLAIHLTDLASSESTLLTFSGSLTGTITPSSSSITNSFNDPTVKSVILGDNEYTVSIGPFTPPGPAGSQPGSIGAHVDIVPIEIDPPIDIDPPNDVPEPSSLVLTGLGLALGGVGAWRRRRLAR